MYVENKTHLLMTRQINDNTWASIICKNSSHYGCCIYFTNVDNILNYIFEYNIKNILKKYMTQDSNKLYRNIRLFSEVHIKMKTDSVINLFEGGFIL